ncbi:EF-P beta-lysylation protein EpmB [Thioalkalivibrio sulfidiphilus]|uniref:L-lysine 2,3-aminomutase n=1 Tax=Thioalkalivibrio sulfidiphilus (strain HL-EbGR7) TaxID=396588 RepID=B8GQC2_THISH|nr:EF-P beta-lysylation protein EpmB [Thioalkalivibrio sulfidiphilus]ACL72317.1 Lysine 2,3-aminomutase [Thioalkalivibrio sulfidiphilus HL-EbGr7]
MITRTLPARQVPPQPEPSNPGRARPWQRLQAAAITDPEVLIRRLGLDPALLPAARRAAELFRLRVPDGYLARMRPGDPNDPLLRQVLPLDAEYRDVPGFVEDPVGDGAAMVAPGLLHKYRGRVLLVTTGACAVHCRYCFRRHFPYGEANPARGEWQAALDYIAGDDSIHEVILSGGDPLSLSDERLSGLAGALGEIPHVRRLRVHSRQPVILPERVDEDLLAWLRPGRFQTVLVIHANHAREIHWPVREALARLARAGVSLLNQSVLLRGVNDDVDTLADLSETLSATGVMPYYLHQLDPVRGASHFQVDDDRALRLHHGLRARLPGYLVPRLVREIPGQDAKSPLSG